MEDIHLINLDVVVELAIRKFGESYLSFYDKSFNEQSVREIKIFIDDFHLFSVKKLEKLNPFQKNNPLYITYIYRQFLNYHSNDKNSIVEEIFSDIFEKIVINNFILVSSENIETDDNNIELSMTLLRESSMNFFIKERLSELLVLVAENYLSETTNKEEFIVNSYLTSFKENLFETFPPVRDTKYFDFCVVETIYNFEDILIDCVPSSFSKIFTNSIWTEIQIPAELVKLIRVHRKRINELILKKSIEESLMHKYGREIGNLNKKSLTQKVIKEIKQIFTTMSIEIETDIEGIFKYDVQKEIFKFKILDKFISLLKTSTFNSIISDLNKILKPKNKNSIIEAIDDISYTLSKEFERNFNSLSEAAEENIDSNMIMNLSKMVLEKINDNYEEYLYLPYLDDEQTIDFKKFLFKNFYQNYFNKIPPRLHQVLLNSVAQILGCHETEINPDTSNYNAVFVADLIFIKIKPNLLKIGNSLNNYWNEKLPSNSEADITNIDRVKRKINATSTEHYNLLSEITEANKEIIQKELGYYDIDDSIKASIVDLLLDKITDELTSNATKSIKSYQSNFIKENEMNLTDELKKELVQKLTEIKPKKFDYDYNNLISTLGISMEKSDLIKRDTDKSQNVILNNFIKGFQILNETINIRIPLLPFLLDSLSAMQYIILTYILENNLQGKLFNFSDKKDIAKQFGAAERTIYNAYNDLLKMDLIILIDSEHQTVIANSPVIVSLIQNYITKQIDIE